MKCSPHWRTKFSWVRLGASELLKPLIFESCKTDKIEAARTERHRPGITGPTLSPGHPSQVLKDPWSWIQTCPDLHWTWMPHLWFPIIGRGLWTPVGEEPTSPETTVKGWEKICLTIYLPGMSSVRSVWNHHCLGHLTSWTLTRSSSSNTD